MYHHPNIQLLKPNNFMDQFWVLINLIGDFKANLSWLKFLLINLFCLNSEDDLVIFEILAENLKNELTEGFLKIAYSPHIIIKLFWTISKKRERWNRNKLEHQAWFSHVIFAATTTYSTMIWYSAIFSIPFAGKNLKTIFNLLSALTTQFTR